MPKTYEITLADGRTFEVDVETPDEKVQASREKLIAANEAYKANKPTMESPTLSDEFTAQKVGERALAGAKGEVKGVAEGALGALALAKAAPALAKYGPAALKWGAGAIGTGLGIYEGGRAFRGQAPMSGNTAMNLGLGAYAAYQNRDAIAAYLKDAAVNAATRWASDPENIGNLAGNLIGGVAAGNATTAASLAARTAPGVAEAVAAAAPAAAAAVPRSMPPLVPTLSAEGRALAEDTGRVGFATWMRALKDFPEAERPLIVQARGAFMDAHPELKGSAVRAVEKEAAKARSAAKTGPVHGPEPMPVATPEAVPPPAAASAAAPPAPYEVAIADARRAVPAAAAPTMSDAGQALAQTTGEMSGTDFRKALNALPKDERPMVLKARKEFLAANPQHAPVTGMQAVKPTTPVAPAADASTLPKHLDPDWAKNESRMFQEIGIQNRRQQAALTPPERQAALDLVKGGTPPNVAVDQVKRGRPGVEAAPVATPAVEAAPAAAAPPTARFTPEQARELTQAHLGTDGMEAYQQLRGQGKSHADALQAVQAMLALRARTGSGTLAEMAGRIQERTESGKYWPAP